MAHIFLKKQLNVQTEFDVIFREYFGKEECKILVFRKWMGKSDHKIDL